MCGGGVAAEAWGQLRTPGNHTGASVMSSSVVVCVANYPGGESQKQVFFLGGGGLLKLQCIRSATGSQGYSVHLA